MSVTLIMNESGEVLTLIAGIVFGDDFSDVNRIPDYVVVVSSLCSK